MWSIKDEETEQKEITEPDNLAGMAQNTMLGIINAEACASKRAMEILSLQADETEARLAGDGLTPEQFNALIEERREIRKTACEQANKSMFKSWQFWLCAVTILTTGVAVGRRA